MTLPRQGYRIEASSSLDVELGFEIRRSFAHSSSFVQRKLARRARARRRSSVPFAPPPVYAANDLIIKPGFVQYLEVVAEWGERKSWIVDKVLIADENEEIAAIATSWIQSDSPYLPMANPGTRPIMIRAGDLVGHLLNPELDLDSPAEGEELYEAYTAKAEMMRLWVESMLKEEVSTGGSEESDTESGETEATTPSGSSVSSEGTEDFEAKEARGRAESVPAASSSPAVAPSQSPAPSVGHPVVTPSSPKQVVMEEILDEDDEGGVAYKISRERI
ncbi:hypothetical protein BDZ89DRAFT_1042398 [Hymenopellis radicata]|nr:hypothetical protein BDZ89DRAFT_1042398 [Hymenopellis radicata]